MDLIDKYLLYISKERRYSERTQALYNDVLNDFMRYSYGGAGWYDDDVIASMKPNPVRNYEVYLLDERKFSPGTVNLHIFTPGPRSTSFFR